MPQSDPRSEPIISWIDTTDLELEENLIKTQKRQDIPDNLDFPSTTELTETTHEQAFREEILNLFNIPKETDTHNKIQSRNAGRTTNIEFHRKHSFRGNPREFQLPGISTGQELIVTELF